MHDEAGASCPWSTNFIFIAYLQQLRINIVPLCIDEPNRPPFVTCNVVKRTSFYSFFQKKINLFACYPPPIFSSDLLPPSSASTTAPSSSSQACSDTSHIYIYLVFKILSVFFFGSSFHLKLVCIHFALFLFFFL